MNAKITIYALWFLFGLWAYVTFIFAVGFVWFLTIKTRKKKYDFFSNLINIIFWTLTFVGQILTIYLYVDSGKSLINDGKTTTFYWVVLGYNFITVITYTFFLFFFSNNFEVKFTEEKLYVVSISILSSSIIKVERNPKKHLVIEYVFKKEVGKIWTEKLIFHKWFSSAKFIEENYLSYFDPARNKAVFDIAKVTKLPKILDPKTENSSTILEEKTQEEKAAKPLSSKNNK